MAPGTLTRLTFIQVAKMINRIGGRWINYYGRYYKSLLIAFSHARSTHIWSNGPCGNTNTYTTRQQGTEATRPHRNEPPAHLRALATRSTPVRLTNGSRVTRECQARFYERRR